MNNFKNMKIEINDAQQLDDIVRELERLGYRKVRDIYEWHVFVGCDASGLFFASNHLHPSQLTTLAELKEV